METGAFKTDDMALATVLSINGYEYKLVKLTNSKALWAFTHTDEQEDDFDTLLDAFDSYECAVEPRQFVLKLAEIRSELYTFLPNRRPSASAPAA